MLKQAVLVLPLLLASTVAHGGSTYTVSATVPNQVTDFDYVLSLEKFDQSLGSLTGVEITLNGEAQTTFSLANNGSNTANFRANVDLDFTLTSLDPAIQALLSPLTFQANLATGVQPVAPGQSAVFGPYQFGDAINESYSDASILALFSGIGTLDFLVSTWVESRAWGVGNSRYSVTTTAGADVSITYSYAAAAVPEPSSIAMLGLSGVAGVVGVVSRRRKVAA